MLEKQSPKSEKEEVRIGKDSENIWGRLSICIFYLDFMLLYLLPVQHK